MDWIGSKDNLGHHPNILPEKTSWKVLFADLLWEKKYYFFAEKVRLKRQVNKAIDRDGPCSLIRFI
jgi:hypothetical protein